MILSSLDEWARQPNALTHIYDTGMKSAVGGVDKEETYEPPPSASVAKKCCSS